MWNTDPYASEAFWPQGFGQLTTRGMEQQYALGQLFFDRYIKTTYPGFIYQNYTRTQMYIRSTDVDRTLMSAQAQLSSLFYPDAAQRFNQTLPWQPIPVHTVSGQEDNLLRAYDGICPNYELLMSETYKSPEYTQLAQQNQGLLKELRILTNITNLGIQGIRNIEDILFIENIYNRTPSWYTPSLLMKLKNISDRTLTLMFNSTEQRRLGAGVFVGELVSNMNATTTGIPTTTNRYPQPGNMKMFMYSAYDTTVAAVMSALGVFNGIQPPYASAFIVELFSSSNNYFVKFFYRNNTYSSVIQELQIPWCATPGVCKWTEFVNFTKNLIPSNWNAECQIKLS